MPTILEFANLPIPSGIQASSLRVASILGMADAQRAVFSEQDGLTDPKNALYSISPRQNIRSITLNGWGNTCITRNPPKMMPSIAYQTKQQI